MPLRTTPENQPGLPRISEHEGTGSKDPVPIGKWFPAGCRFPPDYSSTRTFIKAVTTIPPINAAKSGQPRSGGHFFKGTVSDSDRSICR